MDDQKPEPSYLLSDRTGGMERGTKGIPKDVVAAYLNDPPTFMVAWEGPRPSAGTAQNPFMRPEWPRDVRFASAHTEASL